MPACHGTTGTARGSISDRFRALIPTETTMKTFMAVYIGTASAVERFKKANPEPKQQEALQKKGMDAWTQWVATHQDAIVDGGGPLGKTKRITGEGVGDVRNNLTGYTIVRAESHEAA